MVDAGPKRLPCTDRRDRRRLPQFIGQRGAAGMSAPHDMAAWLDQIGLPEYAPIFAEHAIDREVLADLDDQDLRDLGVPLGHRKKLLKAIAALREPAKRNCGTRRGWHLGGVPARGRAAAADRDVRRSGRLDGAVGPARSRGHGPRDPRLSGMLRRGGRALGRPRRQVHGRWRARLFRLAAGA